MRELPKLPACGMVELSATVDERVVENIFPMLSQVEIKSFQTKTGMVWGCNKGCDDNKKEHGYCVIHENFKRTWKVEDKDDLFPLFGKDG